MDQGGIVTRVAPMGADGYGPRKLAYRIRKNQVSYETGFFVNVCAFATPQMLAEVDRRLKLDERVLRHKTLKKSLSEMASPVPDMDEEIEDANIAEDDPETAMRRFVEEHRRQFPDGLRFHEKDNGERVQNQGLRWLAGQSKGDTPRPGA